MPPLPRLTLIVATTPILGIGAHGTLPWPPLKADLRFFARVTKRPPPSRFPARDGESEVAAGANGQQQTEGNGRPRKIMNAVVMGRKTWDSLPEKVRPLGGRINVVVSRSAGASGEDSGAGSGKRDVGGGKRDVGGGKRDVGGGGIVQRRGGQDGGGGGAASLESQTAPSPASAPSPPLIIHASSLPQALGLLTSLFPPPSSDPSQSDEPRSQIPDQSTDAEALSLGRVFIIGGAQIYALALEARTAHGEPLVDRILWTRVKGEWDCDVHFPRGILPMSGGEVGGKAEAERPGMGWVVRTREEMEEWVGEEGVGGVKKEGEVEFEIVMVERDGGA